MGKTPVCEPLFLSLLLVLWSVHAVCPIYYCIIHYKKWIGAELVVMLWQHRSSNAPSEGCSHWIETQLLLRCQALNGSLWMNGQQPQLSGTLLSRRVCSGRKGHFSVLTDEGALLFVIHNKTQHGSETEKVPYLMLSSASWRLMGSKLLHLLIRPRLKSR